MPRKLLENGDITKHDITFLAQSLARYNDAILREHHYEQAYTMASMFGYIPTYVMQDALKDFKEE